MEYNSNSIKKLINKELLNKCWATYWFYLCILTESMWDDNEIDYNVLLEYIGKRSLERVKTFFNKNNIIKRTKDKYYISTNNI